MTAIDPIGAQPPRPPGPRAAGASRGAAFPAPADAAPQAAHTAAASAAPVALESLLVLQQVNPASERDRAAHRRGQALLAALGRLQRLLLGEGDPATVLDEIRTLTDDVPAAADPALGAAIDQVVLRARIELARRASGQTA